MILTLILSALAGILFALSRVYYRNLKEKRLINSWDLCNKDIDKLIKDINKLNVNDNHPTETIVLLHKYDSDCHFEELNFANSYATFEAYKATSDYTKKERELVAQFAASDYKMFSHQ